MHGTMDDHLNGGMGAQVIHRKKDATRTGRFRNARRARCRCFLPDLTGFTGLHRAGPDPGDTGDRGFELHGKPEQLSLLTISARAIAN